MQPTREEIFKGVVKWKEKHRGFSIELSFHGYHEYTKEVPFYDHGTWCYYIYIDERMFDPKTFGSFIKIKENSIFGHMLDYYNFGFMEFHGGPTYGSIEKVFDSKTKNYITVLKVGCDYNHLYDKENDYPYSYDSVLNDAKHSVDEFIKVYPPKKLLCCWSGQWFDVSDTYESLNGTVGKKYLDDLKAAGYDRWLLAETK